MNEHSNVTFATPSGEIKHEMQRDAKRASTERKVHRAPTRRERFLAEMECTVPWSKLRALVDSFYADPASRRARPLELDRMLRVYFLQRWFRLTDSAAHEAIYDSSAMRVFVLVGPGAACVPDEAAIGKFRRIMRDYGLADMIALATDRHLRSLGYAIAPGAIVDARLVADSNAQVQTPFARIVDTAGVAAG